AEIAVAFVGDFEHTDGLGGRGAVVWQEVLQQRERGGCGGPGARFFLLKKALEGCRGGCATMRGLAKGETGCKDARTGLEDITNQEALQATPEDSGFLSENCPSGHFGSLRGLTPQCPR